MGSGILYNQGQDQFAFKHLPLQAQFSKIFSSIVDDFDGDGVNDILISGNFYDYRTELGACDASLGLLLRGTAQGFEVVDPSASGCYIGGDVRAMVEVKNKLGEKIIVIAKNNDAVQVLKVLGK